MQVVELVHRRGDRGELNGRVDVDAVAARRGRTDRLRPSREARGYQASNIMVSDAALTPAPRVVGGRQRPASQEVEQVH